MTYSSCQVKVTAKIFLHRRLCVQAEKVSSAWAKVWTATWPSGEGIMAPGGRDLGDF